MLSTPFKIALWVVSYFVTITIWEKLLRKFLMPYFEKAWKWMAKKWNRVF